MRPDLTLILVIVLILSFAGIAHVIYLLKMKNAALIEQVISLQKKLKKRNQSNNKAKKLASLKAD